MKKNTRICIICQKTFFCSPSDNNVTCSVECRKEYRRRLRVGYKLPEDVKRKISQKAQGRDMSKLQQMGTMCAQKSPKSGRFETNINAKKWHLISPDGKEYRFTSLTYWLRENCRELFGCEPDTREFRNVRSGLAGAKRGYMGKSYPCATYKGWRVLPTDDDLQ